MQTLAIRVDIQNLIPSEGGIQFQADGLCPCISNVYDVMCCMYDASASDSDGLTVCNPVIYCGIVCKIYNIAIRITYMMHHNGFMM